MVCMKKKVVNKRDLYSSIVLAVIGLYITFGKNVITGKTFGVDSMPMAARADVYLKTLGLVLAVLSLVLLVRAIRTDKEVIKKEIPIVAIIGAASLVVYIFILKPLGFFISSVLLITAWTFMFRLKEYHIDLKDKRTVLKTLGISFAFSIIIVALLQLAFTKLLGVRLPQI